MAAAASDVAMPDMDDPRVQAACRVLGIRRGDLEPLAQASFEGPQQHFQLFTRKRADLIGKVNSLVQTSPADTSKIVESMSRDPNEAFMARVLAKEQEQIEKLGRQAQKDILKIADQELQTRVVMKDGQDKKNAAALRFKELKKQRDAQIKDKKKEALKKQEKSIEVRIRADAKREEESESLKAELQKAQERSTNKLIQIKDAHEKHVAGKSAFWDDLAQRLDHHEKERFQRLLDINSECNAKQDVAQGNKVRLEQARQSNEAFIAQRRADCHRRVEETIKEKWATTEQGYKDIEKRHANAALLRKDKDAARDKEYRKHNAEERKKFESRYASLQQALAKPNISRRLQDAGETSILGKSLSDSQIAAQTQIRGHESIVSENRERLRNSHHYATEQALQKLHSVRMKVDIKRASERETAQRRMDMVANVGRASEEVQQKVGRCQNSGPEKMQSLLMEMIDDPDPEAVKSINEKLKKLGMPVIGDVMMEDTKDEKK